MRLSNRSANIPAFPLLLGLLIGLILLGVSLSTAHASNTMLKRSTGSSSTSSPASSQTCGTWTTVASPNVGSHGTYLNGVAANAASDVWAVGSYTPNNMSNKTVIEHWNGTQWSIIPGAATGSSLSYLYAVAALSANNVWAVGNYLPSTSQTLIEHWNGTKWSIVPSPNVSGADNNLNAITAISANNIWVVGYYVNSSNVDQTLIEHWNGSSWSIVPSPNPGSDGNSLWGVTSSSPNDVWAVGNFRSTTGPVFQTLIEHWNGKVWKVVSSSNVGIDNFLQAVTPIPGTAQLWAVGSYHQTLHTVSQTLTEFYC